MARQSLNDYKKAIGDADGIFELELVYVECGVKFVVEYVSDNIAYITAIEKMLVTVLHKIDKNVAYQTRFKTRVRRVIKKFEHYIRFSDLIPPSLLSNFDKNYFSLNYS